MQPSLRLCRASPRLRMKGVMLNMTALLNIALTVNPVIQNIIMMPNMHPTLQEVINWGTFLEECEYSSLTNLDLEFFTEALQNDPNLQEMMDISDLRNRQVRIMPYLASELPLVESQTRGLHLNRLRNRN